MRITRHVLLFYIAIISMFVAIGAAVQSLQSGNPLFLLLFLPVVAHFLLSVLKPNRGHKFLVYYDFIITTVMAASGFIGAKSLPEIISAVIFLPLALYFWILVLPKNVRLLTSPTVPPTIVPPQPPPDPSANPQVAPIAAGTAVKTPPHLEFDADRRTFLKLVGSAGLAFFLFSLLSNRVEDTFFGRRNVPARPSPAGPAAAQPANDYTISEIDDSSPMYFGFISKNGLWYIMQETDSGSFRYANGKSDFTNNWINRSSLRYDVVNNAL